MSDLISRDSAIDMMCELMRHWFGGDPKDEIREIKRELEKLPSTQQWTPCSERPPKDGSEVFVTTSWNDVCKAWYSNGIWRAEFINEYNDGEILAWMPLPEPYRKDDD